jgi:hypothetical protein
MDNTTQLLTFLIILAVFVANSVVPKTHRRVCVVAPLGWR